MSLWHVPYSASRGCCPPRHSSSWGSPLDCSAGWPTYMDESSAIPNTLTCVDFCCVNYKNEVTINPYPLQIEFETGLKSGRTALFKWHEVRNWNKASLHYTWLQQMPIYLWNLWLCYAGMSWSHAKKRQSTDNPDLIQSIIDSVSYFM